MGGRRGELDPHTKLKGVLGEKVEKWKSIVASGMADSPCDSP